MLLDVMLIWIYMQGIMGAWVALEADYKAKDKNDLVTKIFCCLCWPMGVVAIALSE